MIEIKMSREIAIQDTYKKLKGNEKWILTKSLLPILKDTLEELEYQFPEMKVMNMIDDFKLLIKELEKK